MSSGWSSRRAPLAAEIGVVGFDVGVLVELFSTIAKIDCCRHMEAGRLMSQLVYTFP